MVGGPNLVALATCMHAPRRLLGLTGVAGVVDFALLFVANYGNARGKKYNDPNDLAHSVDMLREVLSQVRGTLCLQQSHLKPRPCQPPHRHQTCSHSHR